MRIFFAGPLTDLANPEQTKVFYRKLAEAAASLHLTYFWAFLSGTDPVKNPEVLPADVYIRDIRELDASDIMVAYVGEPSTGTGIEIEHAHHTKKPVILLYEKGKRISRMLRGCPAVVKELVYENEEDAVRQLKSYLQSL